MKRTVRTLVILASFLLLGSNVGLAAVGAAPGELWFAPLGSKSLDEAWLTGATLLDRFPDAAIVGEAASARALLSAGFHVEGPVAVRSGETVLLLRPRATLGDAADLDDATLHRLGARTLWRHGAEIAVAVRGTLAEDAALGAFSRKALRTQPLRRPAAAAPGLAGKAPAEPRIATNFAPSIGQMVAQVDTAAYLEWIRRLAGGTSVQVGGSPVTFATRYTPSPQCDIAEQYVFEQFQAMGYTDVQYDPYSFSGTAARNVIATLPGTDVPESIVIVGGHLDSTSPTPSTLAPGANDNASGVAVVLVLADILKNYQFRSTIRFIAFTGEEQGLYGSQHYAQAAAARGDPIAGVVICDMVAWYGAHYTIDIEGEPPWDWLMQIMQDACWTYTGLSTNLVYNSWGSDHVPFQDQGYAAFLAIENDFGGYGCYHQTCDTWDIQRAVYGADVTRACLATTAHLAGLPAFYISHTPLPSTSNTTGPYEVLAHVTTLAPLVADSLRLHYSTGWSYFDVPLTPAGVADFHAFIPGQQPVTGVQYYLTAVDVDGRRAAWPDSAPGQVHAFFVGPRNVLLNEGFETGGAGWTHGGTLDDWQCDAPLGLGGDPAFAHLGTKVYGTDLTGLGTYAGSYENRCSTYLESPPVDCSHASGVTLTFWRWLGVQKSYYGLGDIAQVLVNDVPIWVNPSASATIDPDWTFQEFDISSLADGNPAVRLRFTLSSNVAGVSAGWTLDDIVLTGIPNITTTEAAADRLPPVVALYPAVPNPCNPSAVLRFDLPARGLAHLAVYDVHGRLVRTVLHAELGPGTYRPVWDGKGDAGRPSASGVYFYRLSTPEAAQTRKLVLLR